MSKTAFLISCSDHYSHRMHIWDKCLRNRGYDTRYITSDFDHTTKQPFICNVAGCVQLSVRPYRKNLSAERILSHRMFAKSVKRYVETHKPQVIIALLPPNFLSHYLAQYKKKHPNTVLIFDIFDLWPETFPSGRAKKLLSGAFRVWADLRDKNLWAADHIVTECDLFRNRLALDEIKSTTIHLCAEPAGIPSQPRLAGDALELCYLGAINNVIGIDEITALLRSICAQRTVKLHIIGKGERQQEFINKAKSAGADVIFHGAVYDPAEKAQILDRCHFGLNIMRSSVCVGLTMKSVDYFRFGLPIINNIPADTAELVSRYNVGLPLDANLTQTLVSITNEQCLQMRAHTKTLFATHFSEDVALHKLDSILNEIIT